jgi:hypothetical protein
MSKSWGRGGGDDGGRKIAEAEEIFCRENSGRGDGRGGGGALALVLGIKIGYNVIGLLPAHSSSDFNHQFILTTAYPLPSSLARHRPTCSG